MRWTPSTIGALIVIIGGITLKCLEINSEVWALVLIASGFLFGEQYDIRKVERKIRMKEINDKEVKK